MWVPPLGVAMMLTKLATTVSNPVPHRSAMSTPQSRVDVGGRHMALGVEHRDGLGELRVALDAPDVGHGRVGGEELGELADAPLVVEHLLVRPVDPQGAGQPPLVADEDGQAGHEEGRLARPGAQRLVVELGVLDEDLPVGPVADPGARAGPGHLADGPQGRGVLVCREHPLGVGSGRRIGEGPRLASPEAHRVGHPAAVDLDVEPRAQGVDDRGPDPVEPAGGGVGPATELPAGVQLGVDDLDAGQPGARLGVDRHPAAVVAHLHRPVGVEEHVDAVAVAAQGLVDGVVDDLPQAVHEAAGVGGPDVHPRAFANGLQALEDLEVMGGIAGLSSGGRHPRVPSVMWSAVTVTRDTDSLTQGARSARERCLAAREASDVLDCCNRSRRPGVQEMDRRGGPSAYREKVVT